MYFKAGQDITEAGGTPLDYTKYIKTCFDKAYNTQIVRNADVAKLKPRKKTKKPASGGEAPKDSKPEAENKPAEAPKEDN